MDKYQTPESGRRLVTAMLAAEEFFRPHYGPPGIPPERVKILREAYVKTMNDPAFLAEAKKRRLEINPTSGEEMDTLIKEVMVQPSEVIERMKKSCWENERAKLSAPIGRVRCFWLTPKRQNWISIPMTAQGWSETLKRFLIWSLR